MKLPEVNSGEAFREAYLESTVGAIAEVLETNDLQLNHLSVLKQIHSLNF